MQYYVVYFCMFSVFDFICVFIYILLLAITKDVNTKTYNTRDLLQQSTFNLSIPLQCKRGEKSKVMCNASYVIVCVSVCLCVCVCALSHMCMLIHIQKCPVTLIMNPVPPVVCKEIDSYPSNSHNDTTHHTPHTTHE